MEILKKFYAHWMKFAHFLGKINSTIILSVFYLFFIGIYACSIKASSFFKAMKKKDSYWQEVDDEDNLEKTSYQF